jgi:Carboxypeptidase regulatory-like domain
MRRMTAARLLRKTGVAAALLFSLLSARAQSVTAAITGTITDPSGALVSGAHVVARNLSTGVETSAATNDSGSYRIEFLPIGQYVATITAPGFAKASIPAFTLEALQTATFNVKLSVGAESTTLEVTAATPILNTSDYTLSGTFTENTISNFPLKSLDFSALTLYVPGAASTYGNTGTNSIERSTYYSDSVNMNGNRAQANNYTLEGIDMNETFNNLISYSPAPAALGEVKVLTANTPAEFGNVNGAGIVSVLKSGSNGFHGSAYGYVQDYRLNANSWQNGNQTPVVPTNPYSQDQFGGTLGGPIVHNKLFFFVDYLGSRYHTGGIGTVSVLTQKMRAGDFSELLSGSNPIQLYDPLNNNKPYAGNTGVPIDNPVAQFLIAHQDLYPEPNATPTDGIAANNYQAHTRSYKANNQGDIKIDYQISERNKLSSFYAMSTAYDGTTPVLAISFNGPNLYPTKLGGTNWVHTFSPSLLNSLRLGFTRTEWAQNFSVDSTGQFGTSGNQKVGINFPNQTLPGYSGQSISGGIFAGGNPVYGGGLIDNTYSYIDALSWQKGRHFFTFGLSMLHYQNNYPTANNNGYLGQLTYNGNFTKDATGENANSGYGGADFVLDRISGAAVTFASVNVGQRQWRTGLYFNDDFKLTPELTISYGFRYELAQPWAEQNNKTGNIDEATGQVIYAHAVPAGAPAGAGLCKNSGCYDWNFHQFMPRLGFAYQFHSRAVVRGGYSATSFFEGNSSNQRLTSISPFIQAMNVNITQPTSGSITEPLNTQNAFAQSAQAGGTYNVYPQNIQPAYIHNYNLTVEYALTHLLSLQAGYVGESGQHIEDYGNLNQWRVPSDPTSAPYYNNPYIGCQTAAATQICSNGLLVTESRAMMNYNALQAILRQRVSDSGLEYTVNYTYSKSMTNSLGNYALNVNGYSGAFQNYYDSGADYGPAGYDITHNLTATAVYALPIGHGKRYLANTNRIVDEIVGGWRLAAAVMSYSGFPQTLTAGVSSNTNSYGVERANQYRPLHIRHRSLGNWFGDDPSAQPCTTAGVDNGVCAVGAPAQNTFGTSRNGSVRGPGFHNVDMSMMKDFRIVHEHYLGFRFDAFNAFNIVSYGNPDTGINDSGFGQIVQQNAIRSTERHLQFSAHYTF